MKSKKVAVLYSGGKDSTFAIDVLRNQGYEVTCLVSVISNNDYSYMLHTPNIRMTELSSEALEIPIHFGFTRGEKEEELADIRETVFQARKKQDFDFLGSGGLSSTYQKSRLEKISDAIGLTSVAPLWGIDQRNYLRELVIRKYNIILTSVSAAGLDQRWLGKEVNEAAVNELLELSQKFQFNPAFEGGEAETLVLDCPLFVKKRIQILESSVSWEGDRGTLFIQRARLVEKHH